MNNFLDTYTNILQQKRITTLNNEEQQTVLSAVEVLLRRHSIKNRLCCHNNPNNLSVTDVDSFGFVTEVKCLQCNHTMKTTYSNAKWTYEQIYDESDLKRGDHICWHRCYLIWHHAVVITIIAENEPEIKVINYTGGLEVEENSISEIHSNCKGCCDALYRINYQDCYDDDYTILRACKLLNEKRYNMLDRNCEHFSRWCKTGSTNSIQVNILWESLRKLAFMTVLRVIALLILAILVYSHEAAEDNVRNRTQLETLERWLASAYVVITTIVFITYLLITGGSHLPTVKTEGCCNSNPHLGPCCFEPCYECCNKCWCMRFMNSLFFCCLSFICQASCGCILFLCRNIQCRPLCACCRRPCLPSCGLFWRIFCREILAAAGTLCVVLFEDEITNYFGITQWWAISRAALLILISMGANICGYILGIIVGRAVEACCECCTGHAPRNYVQLHETA